MAGFSVDQIDDIKIAVSEVLLALIEHGGDKRLIEIGNNGQPVALDQHVGQVARLGLGARGSK